MGDRIAKDLGADSLDQLELIMTVEELFKVKIGISNASTISTLNDLVETIKKAPADRVGPETHPERKRKK